MRYVKHIGFICMLVVTGALMNPDNTVNPAQDQTLNYVNIKTVAFANAVNILSDQISRLDSGNLRTILSTKMALVNCRLHYKKISFFLD